MSSTVVPMSLADQRIASRQDRYEAWLTAAEAAECRRVLGITLSNERQS